MNEFTGERVIPGQVNIDLWNEHFSRYAFAARFAGDKEVLDCGCGTGYGSAELSQKARRVIGADISGDAVSYAKGHFQLPNLQFVRSSVTQLPLRDSSLDLVVAFEVMEHLPDWRRLIEEAARLLRPDGLFIVSTPNKIYYGESREAGPNPFHEHEFEHEEFRAALGAIFPNVSVLMQNRTECLAFYPHGTFWPTDVRMDASAGTPEQANFFVAICSAATLPASRAFAYVPRAANILREREQHIAKLNQELAINQKWLADARGERDSLLRTLDEQKAHLEEHNRWALQLEQEWRTAQARIVELQEQFAREQQASIELAQAYDKKIGELELDVREKMQWALDTEQRLTGEIEHERAQHTATIQRLEAAENTVDERTCLASTLQQRADKLEQLIGMVRSSRWLSLGRMLGLGPQL